MQKFIIVFTIILLALALQANAQSRYKRIISLSPALTSELYDLDASNSLVGVTKFCMNPGRGKDIVGTLTELNLEKIMLLKPDLIIAGKDANRKKDIEKLAAMGFRVEIFEGCESFECMCEEFLRLGAIVNKRSNAEGIVKRCREEIDAIKSASSGGEKRVMWQVGTNPLIVAGPETFANEFIVLSGGINIFSDLKAKYPRVNMEEVLIRNPDAIIMISGMGLSADIWKSLSGLKAVRTGRVYLLPADNVCQATPARFVEGLKLVSSTLSGAKKR